MKQQIGVDTESVGQSLQFFSRWIAGPPDRDAGNIRVGYSSARQAMDVFMVKPLSFMTRLTYLLKSRLDIIRSPVAVPGNHFHEHQAGLGRGRLQR